MRPRFGVACGIPALLALARGPSGYFDGSSRRSTAESGIVEFFSVLTVAVLAAAPFAIVGALGAVIGHTLAAFLAAYIAEEYL